jgi:hypothetical protein
MEHFAMILYLHSMARWRYVLIACKMDHACESCIALLLRKPLKDVGERKKI